MEEYLSVNSKASSMEAVQVPARSSSVCTAAECVLALWVRQGSLARALALPEDHSIQPLLFWFLMG